MKNMEKDIAALIAVATGSDSPMEELSKLHGDASYRTYYRARMRNGSSFIVMQMPEGASSVSEEITDGKAAHDELPFINVARYLAGLGIAVPRIHTYCNERRLMIIEDLGDELMVRKVESSDESVRMEWYRKALDLLLTMQSRTRDGSARGCVAQSRTFDATLLNWEFDHFREYGIEARSGIRLDSGERLAFEAETRKISAAIESMPYGFTHRDFQSRNIIVKDGALYLIDFQDALMGPAVYDLVALTRDSYVKLASSTVDELVRAYASASGRTCEEVRHEFDLVTVQRKLKDAGRFVFIDRVKRNPSYLKHIPSSLSYVKAALTRLPECAALAEMLSERVPELRQ